MAWFVIKKSENKNTQKGNIFKGRTKNGCIKKEWVMSGDVIEKSGQTSPVFAHMFSLAVPLKRAFSNKPTVRRGQAQWKS